VPPVLAPDFLASLRKIKLNRRNRKLLKMNLAQYSRSYVLKALAASIAASILVLTTSLTAAYAKSDTTAFVGVNVVPMTDDQVLQDQTVIVKAGRIEAIGPRSAVTVPGSAKVIQADGQWLMPGLIDTHVHFSQFRAFLDLFVANGVTTVRALDGHPVYLQWAKDIAKGKRLGPDLHTTGPTINNVIMDGNEEYRFDTAEKARAEVRRQWEGGFRSVKLYTELNAEAYKAAITEAQKLGMYVTGHVPDSVGVEGVVAAGQKEIAHVEELRIAFIKDYDPKKLFSLWTMDQNRLQPVADLLKKNGVAVVTSLTTLQAMYDQTSDMKSVLARPEIAYQPEFVTAMMQAPDYFYASRLPAAYLADVILPFYKTAIRTLNDAKVPLLMGTDSGGLPGFVPGWTSHHELELLVDAGLSPYDALKTATVTPAQIIPGLGDRGVVRVGARADLILIGANPLAKIGNTRAIVGVMANGKWMDDSKRQKMLATAKKVLRKMKL
jgi:imidazolonepropionase-like amidohydrolase